MGETVSYTLFVLKQRIKELKKSISRLLPTDNIYKKTLFDLRSTELERLKKEYDDLS